MRARRRARAVPAWPLLLLLFPAGAALAQADPVAMQWLQKIYTATQKLSYVGTFVYQHGPYIETSRITRFVDASGAKEKLEPLEGGVREIVRSNNQVAYYLPGTQTVKIERQSVAQSFPALLPVQVSDLAQSYAVTKGDVERVAGFECQVINLEPRDQMRYGHRLWADVNTGMLLKARAFNEKHEPLETFSFTQLQIGHVDPDKVKPSYAHDKNWHVEDSVATEASLADAGWVIRATPSGFRKIGEMRRNIGPASGVGHIVLSDGLAAVSVFIEPLAGHQPGQAGLVHQGPINVYMRQLDDHWITVVGETPPESVKFIADAVEYHKP
jgi:sigma-E factor negative regulatory protein RseB